MKSAKRVIAILVLAVLLGVGAFKLLEWRARNRTGVITVGFIYDNDEATPYSYSFLQSQEAVQSAFQGKIKVMMFSDVVEEQVETPLQTLLDNSCDVVFTNGYGDIRRLAKLYPEIQFCQVSNDPYPESEALDNYHTFKGEIYQGRYVSGVVAGLKLKQLIDRGDITPEEAVAGYVAAYPYPEVISGYSAFILGIRSVVPQATLRVRYIDTWDSYTKEKQCAKRLLDSGCIVISQHTDTVGPAVACEEYIRHPAFHVGYNIDMTDVAPKTSLISTKIEWTPYVMEAVRAVLEHRPIEETVDGAVHPQNDMSAGFDRGWVSMTPLNEAIAPRGTQEVMNKLIEAMRQGEVDVFKGDYICVDAEDEGNWLDLHEGFRENADSSIPSFHYILQDVVTIDE